MQDLTCDYYKSNQRIEKYDAPTTSQNYCAVNNTTNVKRARTGTVSSTRRSDRLLPATPKERYIHSYNLLLSRNESALLELQECAHSSKKPLSLSMLKKLLKEYEPIAINRRVRTGGTFLVEVVRARHVKESVILKCIKFLIENGANPNIPSAEAGIVGATSSTTLVQEKRSAASGEVGNCISSSTGAILYPLIIAAARGMSTVVQYLLSVGADTSLRGSSRFRLFSNPRKTVKGVDLTAHEFAIRMRDCEVENGVRREDMRGLVKTISLLDKLLTGL